MLGVHGVAAFRAAEGQELPVSGATDRALNRAADVPEGQQRRLNRPHETHDGAGEKFFEQAADSHLESIHRRNEPREWLPTA